MKTKEPKEKKLRKTYKSVVKLSEQAECSVKLISKMMIELWNMGIQKASEWLQKKEKITAFSYNMWLTRIRLQKLVLDEMFEFQFSYISVDLERQVLKKLSGSYDSFFSLKKKKDNRARMPSPKEKNQFQTLSWSSFKIEGGSIIIPGYKKERVSISLTEYLLSSIAGKKVVYATLAMREGEFELSLVTTSPAPATIENPDFFRAIDLGSGDIAVSDSNGSEFLIPARRPDKFWSKHIASVEARIAKCKKGSRSYKKRREARRKMFNKGGNQHISFQRKVADALVEERVKCLVIGKAKTRLGLAQSKNSVPAQHYGAQNTGYMFRLMLFIKEKAQERGVRVIEYPDPSRESGSIESPESKFLASRQLLAKSIFGTSVPMPEIFIKRHFNFDQGKGQPKKS